uniref:Uncharacterized protein n=1 Tax=Myoviridae sp. ctvns3 TaxID=2825204 RepID=A0A8S5PBP3_9CAUD|nr:MAG TPA: hypothetical protein [Myoviridae sp. ctvns3]
MRPLKISIYSSRVEMNTNVPNDFIIIHITTPFIFSKPAQRL